MTPPIAVLIVDDHPVVRRGLRVLLEVQDGIVVAGEAADGATALALAAELTPDVILLDLKLPGMDGIAVLGELRARDSAARVLVLTSATEPSSASLAVRSGAAGILYKDVDPDALVRAIRSVHDGHLLLAPEAAGSLVRIAGAWDAVAGLDALTSREREVLAEIAKGRSNREIGRALGVAEKTVKAHVSSVLAKLGVQDRTQAALLAVQARAGRVNALAVLPGVRWHRFGLGGSDAARAEKGGPMSDEVLRLRGVEVRRDAAVLLRNVDWTAHGDERWILIGPNGAGKTTLLQVAATLMFATEGTVEVLGERLGEVDIFDLRPRIGLTSAAVAEQVPPGEKVIDLVLTASYAILGRWKEEYDSADVTRAVEMLDALGCAHLIRRKFSTLSEGERKRVQIARALMPDPELLLLDEPPPGSTWAAARTCCGGSPSWPVIPRRR